MGAQRQGRKHQEPAGELPFADILNLPPSNWCGEGGLSRWDLPIKRFVALNRSAKPFDLMDVKDLARAVQRLESVPMPVEAVIDSYARLTAGEIVERREIFVPKEGEFGDRPEGFPEVNGCQDRALVFSTCLRYLGIPAAFTRKGTHSTVRFRFEGVVYEAGHEPNPESFAEVRRLAPDELEKSGKLAQKGLYREGLDPHAIGMRSILDFYICSPNAEAHVARFREKYKDQLAESGLLSADGKQ